MEKSSLIKSKRVLICILMASVGTLAQSSPLSCVNTKLEEAGMQLGYSLKFIGETPYPYAKGNDKSTNQIEPAADVSNDLLEGLTDEKIYNVKLLRESLDGLINSLEPALLGVSNPSALEWINHARNSLIMARMWLGKELGSLRDKFPEETKIVEDEESEDDDINSKVKKILAFDKTTGLTFKEAEENYLNLGQCIRLPEWKGFWFKQMAKDRLLVFTKNNEILDTPFEAYKERIDWQLATPTEEQEAALDEFFGKESFNGPVENTGNFIPHTVTEEDVKNNPDLNAGEEIEIPQGSIVDQEKNLSSETTDNSEIAMEKVSEVEPVKTETQSPKKSSKKSNN